MGPLRSPRVAIVGAGMSGLCMAAHLRRAGMDDFVVFEAAESLGGTWRDNTYPGLSCDVPSRFYQFRFAPNPDWTRSFSPGAEIRRYFDDVADRFAVRPHVRLGTRVEAARWTGGRWRLTLGDGAEEEADFVVCACGVLRVPNIPAIEGLGAFRGAVFHSARWDHDVALAGRRVAVVGTGSTGAQIVGALGGVASRLELFQRTPHWVVPWPNPRISRPGRRLRRRFPALSRVGYDLTRLAFEQSVAALTEPGRRRRLAQALVRLQLRRIADPELRAALTPDYEPFCKRLIFCSEFFDAIQRDDVALVTEPIAGVAADGIVTADGALHEQDVIVLATGFDAHAYVRPLCLTGRDGTTLEEAWRDGPRAYRTVSLPGFPNLFMLMGPHSPVGNYSLTEIASSQARHVVAWLERWRAGAFDAVEPTAAATDAFNAELRAALPRTVWAAGCQSWYLGKDGLPEVWPWPPQRHRRMLAGLRPADHRLERRPASVAV
jgi:cation diffusion facilitator CzcD-associated flavoprotein CzcO